MTYDPTVYMLEQQDSLIRELRQHENEASDPGLDRREQSRAREQANNLRRQLIRQKDSDPSTIYLYFDKTKKADSDAFREVWQKEHRRKKVDMQIPLALHRRIWRHAKIDLESFPLGAFFITFKFILLQPLLTSDENDLYIIENPIRRDRLSGEPFIAASSWKGNLASALWKCNHRRQCPDVDPAVVRLFGNDKVKPDDEPYQAGRLHFFATFFDTTSLEVINPHDRRTRTGKNPILIESVPEDSRGSFSLLYVPFHSAAGGNESEQKQFRGEVAEDLNLVALGLHAMFRTYGFSAKRTSGFGIAEENIEGTISVRFEDSGTDEQGESASAKAAKSLKPGQHESAEKLCINRSFTSFENLVKTVESIGTMVRGGGQ